MPTATFIDVDTQSIRFTIGDERRIYMTPYAVQGYVIAFDAGDEIEPFSFQLRDPKRVARRIRTKAGKAVANASTRARRAATKGQSTKRTSGPTPRAVRSADDSEDEPAKAAKAAYAEAKTAHAGQQLTKMKGPTPTPRVFKRKRRVYGHRLLRINQER